MNGGYREERAVQGHKAKLSPLQAVVGQQDHTQIGTEEVQRLTTSHSQHQSNSGTATQKICFHRLG